MTPRIVNLPLAVILGMQVQLQVQILEQDGLVECRGYQPDIVRRRVAATWDGCTDQTSTLTKAITRL